MGDFSKSHFLAFLYTVLMFAFGHPISDAPKVRSQKVNTSVVNATKDVLWPNRNASQVNVTNASETHMSNRSRAMQEAVERQDSGRDLRYQTSEEVLCMADGYVMKKILIGVTAAEGLYVCAKEGGQRCIPTTKNNSGTWDIVAAYQRGNQTYTVAFYVGVFTWSPRGGYLLVHNETIYYNTSAPARSPRNNVAIAIRVALYVAFIVSAYALLRMLEYDETSQATVGRRKRQSVPHNRGARGYGPRKWPRLGNGPRKWPRKRAVRS